MGSFLGFIVGSFVGSLEKIVGSQKHRHSLRCGGVFHISYEYHCLTIYITRSSLIFQIVSCFSMIKLSFTFFRKAPILILEPIVGTGHGGVTSRERESVEVLPIIGFSYIPSYKQPFKSGISFNEENGLPLQNACFHPYVPPRRSWRPSHRLSILRC